MKRLLIFTAGTSMLENLKDPGKKFLRSDMVEGFRYKGTGAWHTVLRRAEGLSAELTAFAKIFAPLDLTDPTQRPRTTAEIASLYLLREGDQAGDDQLVLLCSDTGAGAFCALVNAMLLAEQVDYQDNDQPKQSFTLAGFSETEVQLNPALKAVRLPQVRLRVVKGLNPSQSQKFEKDAIPNLVGTIADLHYNQTGQNVRTVLNYTGGFKAAIPTLAQSAAVAGGIDLKCLYEDAQTMVEQPLIRIELEAEAQERLLGPSESLHKSPVWLQNHSNLQMLRNGIGRDEWAFYEEKEAGDGVQLSSLGFAMRELLRAKARSLEAGQ